MLKLVHCKQFYYVQFLLMWEILFYDFTLLIFEPTITNKAVVVRFKRRRMKNYIFFLIVGLSCNLVLAQQHQPKSSSVGHLYGKVVDERLKEPIPYASVAIFKNDSVITGNFTKSNGEFSFENLPYGRFSLKISFLGLKPYQQIVLITPKNEEQDLGDIKMELDNTTLNTVEVVDEKSAFDMGIDRKVFNVDKNIVSRGGTATDVMKNIPSVSLDESGNAQVRQNSATIYVDGRPTQLTLDMIPADQIDKVEVITNPSAKFEASATGGIINIVMKTNQKPGYNGIVNAGVGTNSHYNGMVAFNVKQKPFGLAVNYNYNSFINPIAAYNYRTNLSNEAVTGHYNSNNDKVFKNRFNYGSATFDYYINNRNTLSLSENIVDGYFDTKEVQTFKILDGINDPLTNGTRLTNTIINFRRYSTKLFYRKTYPKKDKELNISVNTNNGSSQSPSNFTTRTYDVNGMLEPLNPQLQNNIGKNKNSMYTFQLDFVNPINDSSKLEFGLRSNYKWSDQLMDVNVYDYSLGLYVVDTYLTNHYLIDDLVNAGYVNYTMRYKKINYMFGLRVEQSYYKGTLVNKNDSTFQYNYPGNINNLMNAVFPGIFISKKLSDKKEVQFNITRKIDRPHFRQLAPFIFSSDNKNYTIGNPNLTPEFINMGELNFNYVTSKGNLFFALFFRNTQNPLTNYNYTSAADSSIVISTTVNGKQSNTLGMDNTFKHTLFKGFVVTLNMNLYYTAVSATINNSNLSNQGFYYTAKLNFNYRFPKNLTIQCSGNYESPRIIPQGTTIEKYFIDLGISKEFFSKLTLTLSVSDMFDTKGHGNTIATSSYSQEYWSRRETRYFKINAQFRFGKADATLFKRKGSQDGFQGGDF